MAEEVYFNSDGVLVTRSRLSGTNNQTYQMRNVTSVGLTKTRNKRAQGGATLGVIGLVIALIGIFTVSDTLGFLVALFGVAIVAAIVWQRKFFFGAVHGVTVSTTNEPELVFQSQDEELVHRVHAAINTAWMAGG